MSPRALVRFRAGGSDYAVPLEHVLRVEEASGLAPLPDALPEVAGLLGQLSVLESLGAGGKQVLVLEGNSACFGLRVDEVTEVAQIDDDRIGPPPAGQRGGLVTGVIDETLVIDPGTLAARLHG